MFGFDFLFEFKLDFLSDDSQFLRRLVHLLLDFLFGHSGDSLDLLDSLSLSLLLGFVGLELLVHSSPHDGPSEGLGLELSFEVRETLGRGGDEQVSVLGHDLCSLSWVDLLFGEIANFGSDYHGL